MKTILSVITATCIFSSMGIAAEVCEISDVQAPSVDGRAKSVAFGNGNTVTIIGRVHGVRGSLNLLQMLVSDEMKGVSNEEFLRTLSHIHENNIQSTKGIGSSNADKDSEGDIAFVKSISGRTKISFIADETTPEILAELEPQIKIVFRNYRNALKIRKLPFDRKAIALFRAAIGIVGPYFSSVEPSVVKNIRLIGAEDPRATLGDLGSLTMCSMLGGQLMYENYEQRDAPDWKAILSFQTEVMARFENGTFTTEWAISQKNSLLELDASKNNEVVRQYMNACMQVPVGLEARDKATIQNLVAQNSSGLFFVGKLHLNDMANKLRAACLQK